MAIVAECRTCGKRFKADEKQAGKRAKCSQCGTVFVIGETAPADAPTGPGKLAAPPKAAAPPVQAAAAPAGATVTAVSMRPARGATVVPTKPAPAMKPAA